MSEVILNEIVQIARDIVENKRRFGEWLGDKMEAHISRLEITLKAYDRERMTQQHQDGAKS